MKYAFTSDIHGNLFALDAVLADMDTQGVDRHVCLGDIVDQYPWGEECVSRIQEHAYAILRGNHDEEASKDSQVPSEYSFDGERSVALTRLLLPQEQREYLGKLPLTYEEPGGTFICAHANLHKPEGWAYVLDSSQWRHAIHPSFEALESLSKEILFIGHTHFSEYYKLNNENDSLQWTRHALKEGTKILNTSENRYIINVGSVGQPRDKDTRACYALFDTDTHAVTMRRVEYNVEAAAAKAREFTYLERETLGPHPHTVHIRGRKVWPWFDLRKPYVTKRKYPSSNTDRLLVGR